MHIPWKMKTLKQTGTTPNNPKKQTQNGFPPLQFTLTRQAPGRYRLIGRQSLMQNTSFAALLPGL